MKSYRTLRIKIPLKIHEADRRSASHMKELFELCRAKVKIWKELPNGSHNDTVGEPYYFEYISDFIDNEIMVS